MTLFSWMRNRTSIQSPWGRKQRRSGAPCFRPRLEALEDRCVPSTLTVTSPKDHGNGTLRAEIAAANPGDVIVFSPKLDGQTITLTSGELDITRNLTIRGPGAGQLKISGNSPYTYASRVFEVAQNATVTLSGLTISNGDGMAAAWDAGGAVAFDGDGGGILNHGTLTVSGCTISNNIAYGFGGGGIFNNGTLTVSGCTISNNSASNGGGIWSGVWQSGDSGTATVTNTIVSGNYAKPIGSDGYVGIPDTYGGGIDSAGTLTISGCTVSGNYSAGYGGGISAGGTMTVSGCTLSDNSAYYEGGGIYIPLGATSVYLDSFSVANTINNFALLDPNIGPGEYLLA